MGDRDWKELQSIKEASLLKNPLQMFVPALGNTASFKSQGKRLAKQLEENNDVTQFFYAIAEGKLEHEHQFDMSKKAFVTTLNALLCF